MNFKTKHKKVKNTIIENTIYIFLRKEWKKDI